MPNWLRRRRRYSRAQIDTLGWPHPRPPRDARLVCMHVTLAWVSFAQILAGAASTSVQGQAFNYYATVSFATLMIVASLLVLYAAFCKSQYWSWGIELAGCVGFSGVFLIYSVALVATITDWYSTNGAAWAIGLFVGNVARMLQLLMRLW